MRFTQIMEFKTRNEVELEALDQEWMQDTHHERARVSSQIGRKRGTDDEYFAVIQFESYDEAMRNSGLDQTRAFAEKMQELCDGEIRYIDLDIVWEADDIRQPS